MVIGFAFVSPVGYVANSCSSFQNSGCRYTVRDWTSHVLLLSGQLAGRFAQHMSFCLGSIFALKYFTQWILSVSKQAQLQFSPSHQRTTCGLVGHQPILGGGPLLYFISSLSRESNTITSLGDRGQRTLCRGRHLGAQQVGYGKPAASRILWNAFGS